MRVVVTGAAGFIGSHLSEALIGSGHHVIGLDAFTDDYDRRLKEGNLASLRTSPCFTFHEVDLRYDDLGPLLVGADVVINEAAMPGLTRGWQEFAAYESCNVMAVHRLVEASRSAGLARLVHISTSSVYGAHAVGDETQATLPVSPYGVTKLAAEQLVMAYVRSCGLPALVLRYFSVYGPRQRPDMAFRIFAEKLAQGRPIDVFGDGRQSRSITHVDDCVKATVAAMDSGHIGRTYNVGGGQSIELRRALAIIADELGVTPLVRHRPARPGDQRRTLADCTRAKRDFGYEATVVAEDGLRAEARWVGATQRRDHQLHAVGALQHVADPARGTRA
jgi:nucleoside-diphosphate-sugar epimerase